jgi:hypothetical protein
MAVVFDETGGRLIYKLQCFNDTEISLEGWVRSLCESTEYPAFDDPIPVILPDMLSELETGFSGFACYETVFVLDSPKPLLLEIADTSGSVEVFLNGETAGMKLKPPFRSDLSNIVWQGKNYLAIEVAVFPKEDHKTDEAHPPEKTQYGNQITQSPYIIGSIRLYTQ